MKYAATTDVTSDRSRSEIEKTLIRYGATKFGYGWDGDKAMIQFELLNRQIRFVLPLPSRTDPEFVNTPAGRRTRTIESQNAAYEQAVRQKWRALSLAIKAKLEAVESDISSFEEEFLAHIVLPNGSTVGESIRPQIQTAYESGKMPRMLTEWAGQ